MGSESMFVWFFLLNWHCHTYFNGVNFDYVNEAVFPLQNFLLIVLYPLFISLLFVCHSVFKKTYIREALCQNQNLICSTFMLIVKLNTFKPLQNWNLIVKVDIYIERERGVSCMISSSIDTFGGFISLRDSVS